MIQVEEQVLVIPYLRKVTMVMQAPNGIHTILICWLPYGMQLGTGTFDLIPKIEYGDTTGKWGWLCEALYIYHIGENDNDYTWGKSFPVWLCDQ